MAKTAMLVGLGPAVDYSSGLENAVISSLPLI
jgi:hypothetical protein